MKPLLVGEINPYGSEPAFALYPLPRHASGNRLRLLMGLYDWQYLKYFDRVNLCVGNWSIKEARKVAARLVIEAEPTGRPMVLLGAKVAEAFGQAYEPFTHRLNYYIIPHPSGRNRAWNAPDATRRAREVLKPLLAEIPANLYWPALP